MEVGFVVSVAGSDVVIVILRWVSASCRERGTPRLLVLGLRRSSSGGPRYADRPRFRKLSGPWSWIRFRFRSSM